jgi:hypothetical protein
MHGGSQWNWCIDGNRTRNPEVVKAVMGLMSDIDAKFISNRGVNNSKKEIRSNIKILQYK